MPHYPHPAMGRYQGAGGCAQQFQIQQQMAMQGQQNQATMMQITPVRAPPRRTSYHRPRCETIPSHPRSWEPGSGPLDRALLRGVVSHPPLNPHARWMDCAVRRRLPHSREPLRKWERGGRHSMESMDAVARHPLHDVRDVAPPSHPRAVPLQSSNTQNQPPSLEEVFTGGWLQREQQRELYKQLIQRERPFAVAVEKCVEDAVRTPIRGSATPSANCRFDSGARNP